MDFSVSVPGEWLNRRRSQVAEASRKIRAKKKAEEEELRTENASLLEERTSLLSKITELERAIGDLSERDLDLENELLRTQLEQHKGFLKGFLETISSLEPSETSSKGELSKQNRDFGLTHALRLIAESQTNRDDLWKRAQVPAYLEHLPGGSDFSLWYSRPTPDTLNIRLDTVCPRVDARTLRTQVTSSWTQLDKFRSVFGEDKMMDVRELPEFAVDGEEEFLRSYHAREPSGAKFTDTVFLTATGKTVLSKSTLQLGPGRGPVLSQSISHQDTVHSSKKRSKLSDPVDWGICGTANVYYGLRTVTGHGREGEEFVLADEGKEVERMMSTGIEVTLYWNEEVESIDPMLAGPCCRMIEILTLPQGFKFQAIGGMDDFIDAQGRVGEKFASAIYNYIGLAVAVAETNVATSLGRDESSKKTSSSSSSSAGAST